MKKYSLVLAMTLLMGVAGLTACGGNKNVCSVDGCSQPTYEDGLCKDHYTKNKAQEYGNKAAEAIGGIFK